MAFGLSAASAFLVGSIGAATVGAIASNSASKRASKAMQGSSDAAALQAQIGAEQWDRYQELYGPLEEQYIKEAGEYGSPGRYARAAEEASATVGSQFGKARDRLSRTPGLDPSTPGFASSMVGLDIAQAAADATAQNAARRRVEDTAWARRSDALSLGKGLPAQASSALSSASNSLANIGSYQQNMANNQAAMAGSLVNRIFNPPSTSRWLGGSPTTVSPSLMDTYSGTQYAGAEITGPMGLVY